MEIFDIILPEQFKNWIQFYDYLCEKIPTLQKKENEWSVRFELPDEYQENINWKYFKYQLGYIKAQCWQEIENLRPTVKELYHYMSAANGSIWPVEEIKKINRLLDLLLKS